MLGISFDESMFRGGNANPNANAKQRAKGVFHPNGCLLTRRLVDLLTSKTTNGFLPNRPDSRGVLQVLLLPTVCCRSVRLHGSFRREA